MISSSRECSKKSHSKKKKERSNTPCSYHYEQWQKAVMLYLSQRHPLKVRTQSPVTTTGLVLNQQQQQVQPQQVLLQQVQPQQAQVKYF